MLPGHLAWPVRYNVAMPKKPKRKKKKGSSGRRRSGAGTKARKVVTLDAKLQQIYSMEDLSTTCCRQCTCCRVACPQMKFSEANTIIDHVWNEWPKGQKKELLVTCVEYYFSDSLIKPCPLLKGDECRIYEVRPLNCRLYGLWPDDMWRRRVRMFAQHCDLPVDKLPLNTQCQHVRRTDDKPPLTEERITEMFNALDRLDRNLGITAKQVGSSWNYRTLHDWILLKFWGEDTLIQWTNIILATSQEEREIILDAFFDQVDTQLSYLS